MPSSLPAWPPSLSEEQSSALTAAATDYALAHGLIYRPLPEQGAAPSTQAAIHAPFALLPSPFPRSLFEYAQRLQTIYNEVYARVALDEPFLERVIGGSVAAVDSFQAELWNVWRAVRDEGLAQSLHLGLFRSDYLLHSDGTSTSPLELKQVEFNTISSSFGPLCKRVSELHRYLSSTTEFFGAGKPHLQPENLPQNKSLETLATGLAEGHRAYGVADARLLMVVQEGERNAFDQRWLEYELLEKHHVRVVRATFAELATQASLSGHSRKLVLKIASHASPVEISVVYFRAGYGPADYPSSKAWETRLLLERSLAIKCPTIALQLAGAKKVQQVLSEPGVLEYFLLDPSRTSGGQTFTADDIASLRRSFTALHPLDDSELGQQAYALALEKPEGFVLKPQREGGGNNIYRTDIPPALRAMDERDKARPKGAPREREGYILMSLIQPPPGVGNLLLRAGAADGSAPGARLAADVVSELGIYGTALFSAAPDGGAGNTPVKSQALKMVHEGAGGYLLRTKGRESDEGGVAVGFSVIDSPVLVDDA